MVPAGNKSNRLSSVNHTTKTIHHHHHHHYLQLQVCVGLYMVFVTFLLPRSNEVLLLITLLLLQHFG